MPHCWKSGVTAQMEALNTRYNTSMIHSLSYFDAIFADIAVPLSHAIRDEQMMLKFAIHFVFVNGAKTQSALTSRS